MRAKLLCPNQEKVKQRHVLLVKQTKDSQPPPWWVKVELAGKGRGFPQGFRP
jgi:hypothetical protein